MAEGIQIKNLPSTTTIKQGDTMTIVQDKQNKQLSLDVFANESDLVTLSPLENRCDEVKAKIEVDEYSAEITTSQSISKIGSDDNGANLHENVLDGAYESCVLKGKTMVNCIQEPSSQDIVLPYEFEDGQYVTINDTKESGALGVELKGQTKYRDIDTGEILETFEEGRNLELITVRMPILHTVGKNLFDMNRPYDAITDSQATVVQDTNQITVSSAESGIYVNANFILDKDFFAGKTVTGSCLYESDIKDIGTVQITYQDGNGDHHYQWIKTPKTFTFPNDFIGDVMLCVSANNTGTPQSNTVTVKNIQLELGSTATSYEPHKSSILSLPEEVVLRSLPDGTCDTLNVETGEYVQKIGERNYQDGDTNSNTLVTDGTKTHYKLSSPIITKVDVQGFPHAYKNGHIQLSSGSTEPSLTPTVTYKVPVSRVGQIASNTKSNLRQTIKLDQLEVLVYQSLINAEYENLLVQNSAESATSFTNLSTNDPKDELYYMLKHLIEEDQPVQNMLDKINLFYLYGLLNDEHYFDLLLGGEEDVY